MVCSWDMVWMGLLLLHRLALGSKAALGLHGYVLLLQPFSFTTIDWCKFFYTTGRLCYRYRVHYKFCVEPDTEYQGLSEEENLSNALVKKPDSPKSLNHVSNDYNHPVSRMAIIARSLPWIYIWLK
jgi:hypothetical protein